MVKLTERLSAAASLVDGGGSLADVGTDHAYLPAFLCLNGRITSAIASDIGKGPLLNAERTVKEYALQNKIQLRLSDGLQNIKEDEADEIVIAGMGGILISEILTAAPWVKREGMHLVLQPMTHPEDVRRYLYQNGFTIEKELCVREGRRVYICISAYWRNRLEAPEEGKFYFGKLINEDGDAFTYVQRQYDRIKKRADALKASESNHEEEQKLRRVLDFYEREKKK